MSSNDRFKAARWWVGKRIIKHFDDSSALHGVVEKVGTHPLHPCEALSALVLLC